MGIEGTVDFVTNQQVHGWVYRDDDHSEHLIVTVQLRGTTIGSTSANQFRKDLKKANIGEGDHAYSINLDRRIAAHEFGELIVLAFSHDGQRLELMLPPSPNFRAEHQEDTIQPSETVTRLGKTLKYCMTYAESADLLAPVGYPIDFIDDDTLAEYANWTKASPEEMRERLRRDEFPIPHPDNREGYYEKHHLIYWLSGYIDYLIIQDLAREHNIKSGRYFDFGGSTGRVFRHFAFQTDAWDVWSSDFKIASVEFNLKYFPSNLHLFLNTSFPHLPLPDAYFDLISAVSVFTHIDETETGWLLELRRILKVGGLACISIHGKDTWAQMSGELRDYVLRFRPDIADNPAIPEGRTVVTFRDDDPYRCQTFHSDEYIERNWGRFFEICEIRPLVLGEQAQAMVICRRPD